MLRILHLAHDLREFALALKELALVGAAVFGAWCAWQGLSEWRRRLRGEVGFDVARRTLEATLHVSDAIQDMRHPWRESLETAAAAFRVRKRVGRDPTNDEIESELLLERWQRVRKALIDLNARRTEAEVFWRKEVTDAMSGMFRCARLLRIGLRQFRDDGARADKATHAILKANIVEGGDSFADDLTKATESIKEFLAPKLNP